jgi:hypothetical protein
VAIVTCYSRATVVPRTSSPALSIISRTYASGAPIGQRRNRGIDYK